MRTASAALLDALRSRPVFPVAIVRIALADRELSFVTGDRRRFGYAPSVVSIAPVGTTVDTAEKRASISGAAVVFRADGALRRILVGDFLKNKRLTILLGADGVEEADYLQIWVGKVSDVVPTHTGVRVQADGPEDLLSGKIASNPFLGHPLEVLLSLLQDTNTGNLPNELVAVDTFEPTDYLTTFSHYKTQVNYTFAPNGPVGSWRNTPNPTANVWDLVNEITAGLPGLVLQRGDGKLAFGLLDQAGSVSRHLRKRDLLSFEVNGTVAEVVNRVSLRFMWDDETDDYLATYTASDSTAQGEAAYPGETATVADREPLELRWFRAHKELRTALDGSTDPVSVVCEPSGSTFTGDHPGDADMQPSVARPVYLRIGDEILKATGISYSTTIIGHVTNEAGELEELTQVVSVTFTGCARAQLGTSIAAHARGSQVYDYTQAVQRAEDILGMRAYGLPRCRVRLHLDQIELEALDLVTFDHEVYAHFGVTQADSSTVWRIVECAVAPGGQDVGIDCQLEWVRDDASPAVTASYTDARSHRTRLLEPVRQAAERQLVADAWVVSGLGFTPGVGLAGTLASGEIGTSVSVLASGALTKTFGASKDTYVYADLRHGGYHLEEVALSGTPSPPDWAVPLWSVTTDGSSITTYSDLRKAKPINGANIQEGTVGEDQLDDAIVATIENLVTVPEYVVAAATSSLANERVLTAGTGLAIDNTVAGQSIVKLASGYGLLSGLTNDQVAVASGASSLDGSSSLTFDGTSLYSGTRVQIANAGTSCPLEVGGQSSAGLTPTTGVLARFVGANSTIAAEEWQTFAAEAKLVSKRSEGTLASPTQCTAGKRLFRQDVTARDNAGSYQTVGQVTWESNQNITSTGLSTTYSIALGTSALSTVYSLNPQTLALTPRARTSGSAALFSLTGPSDNALAAGVEAPDSVWTGGTKLFSGGAGPTRQADHKWTGATHSAGSASTFPKSTTGYTKKPTAGTNMTITLPVAHEFEGHVLMTAGRVLMAKGADVASANDMIVGTDGNVFTITGTTQINGIKTSEWQAGGPIWLIFASTPTVKHNTAPSAGYAKLKLAGSVDLVAAADTVLGLVYDGTYWQEFARKVA